MIHIWPNGDWCWHAELADNLTFRSDDYETVSLPEWADDDDADTIATLRSTGMHMNNVLNAVFGE